ncbi:MAG: cytochrome c biogenesis protein CcdA [Limnochordia bacterium]|nr:cytochrome c biogenesis protein CcdA [Limnochordia bacterium]MDD2630804.1 cytochrome c biogenesis protein CcdA [Limnochordia bacterium]
MGSLWRGSSLVFLTLCLTLVPSYLSYLTGYSAGELAYSKKLDQLFTNAVAFVVGFSFVFTLLGFPMSFIGQCLLVNLVTFRKVAGVFIVVFGLYTAGCFGFIPSLKRGGLAMF